MFSTTLLKTKFWTLCQMQSIPLYNPPEIENSKAWIDDQVIVYIPYSPESSPKNKNNAPILNPYPPLQWGKEFLDNSLDPSLMHLVFQKKRKDMSMSDLFLKISKSMFLLSQRTVSGMSNILQSYQTGANFNGPQTISNSQRPDVNWAVHQDLKIPERYGIPVFVSMKKPLDCCQCRCHLTKTCTSVVEYS